MKNVKFSSEYVARALGRLGVDASDEILIAVSGGTDSLALLHAVCGLGWSFVRAVHINHGLQPQAGAWGRQVCDAAAAMGVPCEVVAVTVVRTKSGPEADARAARYRALAAYMRPREVVMTAHHANDQAETVLLRLMRGTGPAGLSGMAAIRPFGAGRLARPVLDLPKAALVAYAARHALAAVQDPSNDDRRYARNYVRHVLIPAITARWPQGLYAINRAARHARADTDLLSQYVARDVAACTAPGGALQLPALRALGSAVQGPVVRAWLAGRGGPPMSEAKVAEVLSALAVVPRSRRQVLRLGPAGALLRYRDQVVWEPGAEVAPGGPVREVWAPPFADLALGDGRRLRALAGLGQGIAVSRIAGGPLTVATRTFGQKVFVPGRGHRDVKRLLQEMGIAPWDRPRVILICAGEVLIAVADHWVCAPWQARPDEPGLVFHIES
ncbi:tRNA lysidine(34) synthetase TilS [Acidiferrobacter sp.]|uniref:tRNA lysidine(34) synthetase TilS n=1 Tax=Acidiferrobacter sp. TaxID=1872107 RepID=UPI0026132469|nr:tRNA lysidine(34) synthetase TilS [Acidiferrobacter sp.]